MGGGSGGAGERKKSYFLQKEPLRPKYLKPFQTVSY